MVTRTKELGDHVTLYHLSEFCDPNAEALWFEGKTWSYDELRRGQLNVMPSISLQLRKAVVASVRYWHGQPHHHLNLSHSCTVERLQTFKLTLLDRM